MTLAMSMKLTRETFQLALDCELPSHGFSALYGPSGSGKTTLLRWLAGLEPPLPGGEHNLLNFKGQIWQDEKLFLPPQQRQLAFVFQDARLFPHLSVAANLDYAYQRRFAGHGPTPSEVTRQFDLQGLLAQSADRLSGGQQQRVALARALLSCPQLILMDEPLSSLDGSARESTLQYLEQLHLQLSAPVIYVSHNIEEVCRLSDQLLLIDKGRLLDQGPTLELCSQLDSRLSEEENAASILLGEIDKHEPQFNLSEVRVDGQRLYLSQISAEKGQRLRLRIPARDVSLALSAAPDSSILNILPCRVDAIRHCSPSRVLVRLQLGEQFLLSRLTSKSAERLGLHSGQELFAQIKTVALLSEPTLRDRTDTPAEQLEND